MRAAVLKKENSIDKRYLEIEDYPQPVPQNKEVLIQVEYCGVCHTDLHIVDGDLKARKLPVIPGHQAIGKVIEIGADVKNIKIGDCIGTTWLYSTCQKCDYCINDQENLCEQACFTGYDTDGGFAQYQTIPAEYAVKIPADFSSEHTCPLLCAGVIGYRSLKLCGIKAGQRLGLYGFGASAHIGIQIAKYWNCSVYVFTRQNHHQNHAKKLGAIWTGAPEDHPPELMDASILFAPVGKLVHISLKNLKRGGTVAINAVHLSPIPELSYDLIYHEKTIRSVANCTRKDAQELMELAVKIPLQTDIELSSIEQINDVLQKMKISKIEGAAVLKI